MNNVSKFAGGAMKTVFGVLLLGIGAPIAFAGFNRVVDGSGVMVEAFTKIVTNK